MLFQDKKNAIINIATTTAHLSRLVLIAMIIITPEVTDEGALTVNNQPVVTCSYYLGSDWLNPLNGGIVLNL